MTASLAIVLLTTASLTDALSSITRIDSSLNDISPSVGSVLQGGSLVNEGPIEAAVRSYVGGVPMGGGLVGDLLTARFGAPYMPRHVYTEVSGNGHTTRTTQTVVASAGVPGGPAALPGATLQKTETTYASKYGPHRAGSFSLTWGGPLRAPSSGFFPAPAFHGNWPPNGGFPYIFHGGYPAGGFGYIHNDYYPFNGYGYAEYHNGGYDFSSGYGLGGSDYYLYPGFGGYPYGG